MDRGKGALVADAAARAGLRPGDVIVEVNRRPVQGPRDATSILDSSKGKVLLRVVRQGSAIYVVVERSS
ncbi:MAG: hypothetical protein HC923_13640 [Myxococcales bacterium]|nr:hypothetical protein [Myxococcales bacterium]